MKTLIQTLFFFLIAIQICFGQWYQQNSGTTKNLLGVHFANANNGWAVGDSGTILKTTDLGNSWNTQTSGTTQNLFDVQFINSNNGWAVGDSGTIITTTNGGTNWFQQISDTTLPLNAVFFIDENIGWAVGGIYYNDIGALILKTTNSGNNWITQSASTLYGANDVYFINADTGFIVGGFECGDGGDGVILKTTNGGETWIEQTAQSSICWNGISFSDAQNAIVVGTRRAALGYWGDIFRTTDGGTNWIFSIEIEEDSRFNSMAIINTNYVWAVGELNWPPEDLITFSSDGGLNWSRQGAVSSSLNDICFINSTKGWTVGDNGTILHTTNGGVTFAEEEQIDGYPTEYNLTQNFPNPFNPSTKIKYSIPQSSKVVIKVFDVLGNEIEILVNKEKPVGTYELTWNAANLPSGVYFYQLRAGDFIETKKMILIK